MWIYKSYSLQNDVRKKIQKQDFPVKGNLLPPL